MKPEPHIQNLCKVPYLVATEKGYTKHYYAESERIASKIGGGIFSYEARRISKFVAYKKLGMCKRLNSDCSKRPKGASLSCLACRFQFLATICVAAKRLSFGSFLWQDKEKEQIILHDSLAPEKHLFWYHPDHLGSSSWITYTDGKSIQHLHYLPFGESFVDQRISSFGSRYTFSAKEKDVETGYGFFGARYYSSDLSIWISVDPMSDKYPSMSAYVYCANNPVKLVDPNGEDWIVCWENNQYEWRDNVTQQSETPEGYRYVGANDSDILTDLNIGRTHQSQTAKRIGLGNAGDENRKTGAPLVAKAQAQGDLDVSAVVSYNSTNTSKNNVMGRTFEGVNFKATVNTNSSSSNQESSMNYQGTLCLTVNGEKTYRPLSAGTRDNCVSAGTSSTSASIFYPANSINRNTSFQEASISLGAPNPNIFNRKINFIFNLMMTPIYKAN